MIGVDIAYTLIGHKIDLWQWFVNFPPNYKLFLRINRALLKKCVKKLQCSSTSVMPQVICSIANLWRFILAGMSQTYKKDSNSKPLINEIYLRKSVLSADSIFPHEQNGTWITNKFHIQNKLHLSGLLSLAAFLKHSGNLYERSGDQMEAWPVLGWLWVAAQLCGVE